MSARRSLLFVPGNRPERFGKALAAGADLVCVDLEDAVAAGDKAAARVDAIAWLAEANDDGPARVVRINALSTVDGLRDLTAVAEASPGGFVFLPKVNGPDELRIADAVLTEAASPARLVALIETVEGLENVAAIAAATPRLEIMLFGAVDLSADLGATLDREALLYARSRVVHAARRAGVDVLDVPSIDFRNLDALEDDAVHAKALGFTGKAALHPINIEVINRVFSPSPEELAEARAIVEAYHQSTTGLAVVNGKLVEKPVVRRMERLVAAASG